jgi:putative endonuclease
MFYTYILFSDKTNKYYIGSTGNLEVSLSRHNGGRSKATKTGVPWILEYFEEYETKSQAYQREMELKSWKSHSRVAQLIVASRFLN